MGAQGTESSLGTLEWLERVRFRLLEHGGDSPVGETIKESKTTKTGKPM